MCRGGGSSACRPLHLLSFPPRRPPAAGNLNLDGPIYIDLAKHVAQNGKVVWQVKDTYYGGAGRGSSGQGSGSREGSGSGERRRREGRGCGREVWS
jgi:hypothetical protein